jgi:hypothetical protein
MKRYDDIVGDGGSRILEQVAEQRTRITRGSFVLQALHVGQPATAQT